MNELIELGWLGILHKSMTMNLTCFIEYQIDPFKLKEFSHYAQNWGKIIPDCGGKLLGYFTPHEGTNDIAFGIIGFDSLADYEAYRNRLKSDPAGKANFEFAEKHKMIKSERRTFLRYVEGTCPITSAKFRKGQGLC